MYNIPIVISIFDYNSMYLQMKNTYHFYFLGDINNIFVVFCRYGQNKQTLLSLYMKILPLQATSCVYGSASQDNINLVLLTLDVAMVFWFTFLPVRDTRDLGLMFAPASCGPSILPQPNCR